MNPNYDYYITKSELEIIETTHMSVNVESLHELLNNVYQFAEAVTSEYLDTDVRERLITNFPDPEEHFSHDMVDDLLDNDPTEFFEHFERHEPELFQEIVNAKTVALYLITIYNGYAKFLQSYKKIRDANRYSLDELVDMYATQMAQAALLQNYAYITDLFRVPRKAPAANM